MNRETAIGAALKTAGIDTDAALLRVIAEDQLRKVERDARRALAPFTEEVRDAGGIMAALVPYATTRDLAWAYLERVVADMLHLEVPAKAGDGVHLARDGHGGLGPIENSEGDGSNERLSYGHHALGPLPSDSVPSRDGGGVRNRCGANGVREHAGSPEQSEDERVQARHDCHSSRGPSSSPPIPKPPRGLDAMRLQSIGRTTIYDTFRTRDGPLGDLRWSSLPRLIRDNTHEAALLKLIYDHCNPADPNARVRDIIKIEDLQRMVQKAAENVNGQA